MKLLKRVTLNRVLKWGPCPEYTEERLLKLSSGRKSLTPLQIARLDIPIRDRFWALFHPEIIPKKKLHTLACDFADRVLPIFEGQFPDDHRPRNAIETKRRWVDGEATDEELSVARNAAGAATRAAAWAARAGAWDTARAAAWDTARNAAWDTARAAAWAAAGNAAAAAGDAVWDTVWDVAQNAARATAWDTTTAAGNAACAAAGGTAWIAAWGAAGDTIWTTAWGAEQKWQLEQVIRVLGEKLGQEREPD